MTQIPLGNGFYKSASTPVSAQECTNMYPVYPQSDALSEAVLFPTPGTESLIAGDASAVRGGIEFLGCPYIINDNTLYRIDQSASQTYSKTSLGTISGVGRVSIAKNNTQICIVVPGGDAYIYSVAGGLVTITDVDFDGPANTVDYIDGYFIFTKANKFWCSDLNDGTSYNALFFATAEVDPDNIVGSHVYKNQLFIFGTKVTEVYDNVGGADFPFQRIDGFIIDKGLTSPFAVADFDDTFIFLGAGENEQPAIWRVEGSTPIKVSTTAVDNVIQGLTELDLSTAFVQTYSQRGAYFAAFTFVYECLVFESIASAFAQRPIWHKRESQIGTIAVKWRVGVIVKAFGRLIVGDSFDGAIGALEPDVYTEYGNNIRRLWSGPPVGAAGEPIFLHDFELTLESGTSPEGDEGFIDFAMSFDGGRTYEYQMIQSIGKIGEYGKRLIWDRLGRADRYVNYRIRFTGNMKLVLIRADGGFDIG